MTPRYRLIQDDAGHWYVIRTDQEAAFKQWCRWRVSDPYGRIIHDFAENRVDGPHTVTFGEWEEVK